MAEDGLSRDFIERSENLDALESVFKAFADKVDHDRPGAWRALRRGLAAHAMQFLAARSVSVDGLVKALRQIDEHLGETDPQENPLDLLSATVLGGEDEDGGKGKGARRRRGAGRADR